MNKQELARKRNYFKFVLAGMHKPVDLTVLTEEETSLYLQIRDIRKKLMNNFEHNSRHKGLNVPKHRCWCGKEGKYKSKDDYYIGFVCKKHTYTT